MHTDNSEPSGGVLVVAVGQMDIKLEWPELNLTTMPRLTQRVPRKDAGWIVLRPPRAYGPLCESGVGVRASQSEPIAQPFLY